MHCRKCGKKASDGANFCGFCGSPMSSDTAPDDEEGSDIDDDWDFDKLHPKLGHFFLNEKAADLGWAWWDSSFYFGRSGWRPVRFEQYDFEGRYRLDIEPIISLLDQIAAQQGELIALIEAQLRQEGRDLSGWAVALANIDEVRINHNHRIDVAAVYFGEFFVGKGYRYGCVTIDMSGAVLECEIGSI
jgi:hypothetical protein